MKRTLIFSVFIFLSYCQAINGNALFLYENASITAQDANSKKYKGLFDFEYHESQDKVFLYVPESQINKEFLYMNALTTGLGSNDIGLDRGQLGNGVVVKWIRVGNKLLLKQPNLKYRAITNNSEEKKSVEQAFAHSILFSAKIESTENSIHRINITSFLKRDAHGVTQRLKNQGEGSYTLDKQRSVIWAEGLNSFPKNIEFEALLTFKGSPKGRNVRSVVPDPSSISLIQHHSFIALPEKEYKPRKFHPRSGSFQTSYYDYASDIGEPLIKRFVTRHHLEKKNPNLDLSEPVEPIVYYLDSGTPEPIRSALLEGARWWNDAFTSAGFKNAFQVKMLPPDAHPLDIRYNMIQWVHRSTRGWSYGGSIVDPRTGEILKGHVSLGSLRIRQDYLLAQGMMYQPFSDSNSSEKMKEFALARIRQLSAHEIGHTLGFAHNFAASASQKASVMDYPHPEFVLENNQITFSNAYDIGIGEWDKLAVQYAYGVPKSSEKENEYLAQIIDKGKALNIDFISDRDARDPSGAHATAHLWDNGSNAAQELERISEVRAFAIKQFSMDNIPNDQPMSVLEDVFVPLYFSHRYQVEATSKVIGGMRYTYAVKGDDTFEYVSRKEQQAALRAILKTLDSDYLVLPEHILELFPPRAYGYSRSRESFKSETGVAFDPVAAAITSASLSLDGILNPTRLNRVVQQSIYGRNLNLNDVLDATTDAIMDRGRLSSYHQLIRNRIKELYVDKLLTLQYSNRINVNVKAVVQDQIINISKSLKNSDSTIDSVLYSKILQAKNHPELVKEIPVMKIPDGSPIGSCSLNFQG